MRPLVSIGVPLYNAQKYARRIRNLWRQTYPAIELICSDNGSTDQTLSALRTILRGRKNVTLLSSAVNRGLSHNFNRVFRRARGKYFMWASLDDHRASNFIEKCVELMENRPEVVLAVPTVHVAVERQPGRLYTVDVRDASQAASRKERFAYALNRFPAVGLYGLFRTDALAQTRLMAPMPGGDLLLIPEIALLGHIQHVPETNLIYSGRFRWNSPEEDYRAFTGKTERPPTWPGIWIWREKILRLGSARLGWPEKSRLFLTLFAHLQREVVFRLAKKLAQGLPHRRTRAWMLEKLYFLGWWNPAVRIRNRHLYRARVIGPVMGLPGAA